jgi:cobalamin biosynthesis Mg chelatase CobN
MDTKSSQKTRRTTKVARGSKGSANPGKKTSSRSKKTGEIRPESTTSTYAQKDEVTQNNLWFFGVAVVVAALVLWLL